MAATEDPRRGPGGDGDPAEDSAVTGGPAEDSYGGDGQPTSNKSYRT